MLEARDQINGIIHRNMRIRNILWEMIVLQDKNVL